MTGTAPRIAGYELSLPTEQDAVAALTRVFGADRAQTAWAAACRGALVTVGAVTSPVALERVADALAKLGAAEAAVGRSIAIRLRTYARLSARGNTPNSSSAS
jgi:hypothetical protein